MRTPRLTREEREKRNARILGLFVAGLSERQIGKAVNLTGPRVHQILKEELKKEAASQQLVTDQALSLYVQRLDTLLASVWQKATRGGDLKAVEIARRILEQQARLYDLEEEKVPGLPSAPESELEGAEEIRDELQQYRLRHRRSNPIDAEAN